MEKFEVHILGCGSALPTLRHLPSAQLINLREKLFLVDCGEGTQLAMRRSRHSFSRLSCIFISHLHGDHVFGLMGLISTLALSGRRAPLHIYAPPYLETLMRPHLDYFCKGQTFPLEFHSVKLEGKDLDVIYEDRSVTVTAVKLDHRVASYGFIFREKPLLPHIRRDMIDFLSIPYYAINAIKGGEGWTTEDGDFYPHEQLVIPAKPPRAYAYCSDTAYIPTLAERLQNVNVLYHEATFTHQDKARAEETRHSTAAQAAMTARDAKVERLVIGHYSSRYNDERLLLKEAREIFQATEAAQEGLIIQI